MSAVDLSPFERDELFEELTHRRRTTRRVARLVWGSFLITFLIARIMVLLIMTHRIRSLYLHMGTDRTHVHHLNYGIFLLSAVGAFLLFRRPTGKDLSFSAVIYGIGLALTFDEFGMWLHLGGPYWQRASFDAVVVIGSLLSLIVAAPAFAKFRPHHFVTAALLLVLLSVFGYYFVRSLDHAERRYVPYFLQIEEHGPE
jgi:hypothetical protein